MWSRRTKVAIDAMSLSNGPPKSPDEFKQRIQAAKLCADYLTMKALTACGGQSEHARVAKVEIQSRRLVIDGVLTWMPVILDAYVKDLGVTRLAFNTLRSGMFTLVSQLHTFLETMHTQDMSDEARSIITSQIEALDEVIRQMAPEGLDVAIAAAQQPVSAPAITR